MGGASCALHIGMVGASCGLGGWLGAIGAIIAIFVTWSIARSEYLRVQRIEAERVNSEIALFARTASDFQPLVTRYIELLDSNDGSSLPTLLSIRMTRYSSGQSI